MLHCNLISLLNDNTTKLNKSRQLCQGIIYQENVACGAHVSEDHVTSEIASGHHQGLYVDLCACILTLELKSWLLWVIKHLLVAHQVFLQLAEPVQCVPWHQLVNNALFIRLLDAKISFSA